MSHKLSAVLLFSVSVDSTHQRTVFQNITHIKQLYTAKIINVLTPAQDLSTHQCTHSAGDARCKKAFIEEDACV